MWLCVENPIDLNKCIICVTTSKVDPHDWYVRVDSRNRTIGGSYNQAGPVHFQKIGFKSTLKETKEVEVDVDMGDATYCTLTGLVDDDSKMIYALHGKIHIKDEAENTVAMAEAYMRMDYARVTPE